MKPVVMTSARAEEKISQNGTGRSVILQSFMRKSTRFDILAF
jgi:hypothetical protein